MAASRSSSSRDRAGAVGSAATTPSRWCGSRCPATMGAMTDSDPARTPVDRWERAVPDLDGEPAIADTLYAATEELEQAAPELRARADSIAEVVGPLVHDADPATVLTGEPDPAAMLADADAERLAGLLTDASAQAGTLADVLQDAADQADGLAAVLTDDQIADDDGPGRAG